MTKKEKLIELAKVLLVIIILSVALRYLIPTLTSEEFKLFVQKLGPLGPLVIIIYTTLSHVLAPLAGTPGILLSVAVFGIFKTMFYIYLGSMISAALNFYISRKFGRGWVTRLVGKRTMKEVDDFVKASGEKVLILSRIFGFSLFEIISYAAGLTNINFKRYLMITLLFTLIPNLFFTYLFRNMDFSSNLNLVIWLATLIITGLIFSFFIKKAINKKK
ncbi:MAG: VTT domain-containing protein [Candidatus Shapirobacteria bacterium]